MLTNNFLLALNTAFGNGTSKTYKNASGITYSTSSNIVAGTTQDVLVGTDNTTPSKTDYAIQTTGLTKVSSTKINPSYNFDSILFGWAVTTTYINNTNSAITIREVGLSVSSNILLNREVIEPITIQPGESVAFTIKYN